MSAFISVLDSTVAQVLSSHQNVPGISVGLIFDYQVYPYSTGIARHSANEALTNDHYMECASLSKTVGTAFAIQYFTEKSICMSTSVNFLLKSLKSSWFIENAPGSELPAPAADSVTLAMLTNHTALGMHYVYGIPLSDSFPPIIELLNGTHSANYGYKALYLERMPGEKFSYSGGGFLVLQLILELMEGRPIESIMRPFLDATDMSDFTFYPLNLGNGTKYAYGHIDAETEVRPQDGGRLSFPPLAAGGLTTTAALATFISALAKAYHNPAGCGAISHSTARYMLGPEMQVDNGARKFMNANASCGVFVATAGPNKIMLHQAANDGFRGVYFMCFDGPDQGNGALILTNGDNPSLFLMCEVANFILGPEVLNMRGVDLARVTQNRFSLDGIPQEVIVNLGLKELVFNAFVDENEDIAKSLIPNSKL